MFTQVTTLSHGKKKTIQLVKKQLGVRKAMYGSDEDVVWKIMIPTTKLILN